MSHPLSNVVTASAKQSIMAVVTVLALAILTLGQEPTPVPGSGVPTDTPFVNQLKGISIGMTPDEVVEKLGKPKASDDAGMLFSLAKNEMAQIGIGPKGKVRAIALIYEDGDENAPSIKDVFGQGVDAVENEDGSIYKMIRYEKEGFWMAFSRSGDKKPLTTVMLRQID